MPKKVTKRNKKIIQLCFYVGYGEAGIKTLAAIKRDAKACNLPVYRYILNKLGL
jgi:hypothetical protein